MVYQNHLVDPTYFYDAIEEFSFNFKIYVLTGITLNQQGKEVQTYEQKIIRGSLQSQGKFLRQSKDGNKEEKNYKFYCKSLYRLDIGDVIEYKGNYYRCNAVDEDYDEYGVRACSLEMIKLNAYRDLAAYIKYLEGEELV